MFLSDRDLEHARKIGDLRVIDEHPVEFDPSGIDLHLDLIDEAKVWDSGAYVADQNASGTRRPYVGLGSFDYKTFAQRYAVAVPTYDGKDEEPPVYRDGGRIIMRPCGYFLWQTR